MPIYSHSRISTYENCPLRYKFQYIDKVDVEERQSIEAFLGSRVHEAIQKIYRDLNCGKENSLDEVIAFFRSEWEKTRSPSIFIVKKDLTAADFRNVGETCIAGYYNRNKPFRDGKTIGIERRVAVDLDAEGRYPIQGYIDRLVRIRDGVYEIHDYKTSGQFPTQEEMDTDRQLAIYQMAIQTEWADVEDVTLVWHYLRHDAVFRSKRTQEQLAELRQALIAKIDKIEEAEKRKDFPAKKNGLCQYCDYIQICPMWIHELKVAELPPNEFLGEDGVALVNKYAALERERKGLASKEDVVKEQKKKVEEALFAYREQNQMEIIVGSEYEVELKAGEKQDFPHKGAQSELRTELEDYLKTLPIWEEISDLSPSKLKSALEEKKLGHEAAEKVRSYIITTEEKKVSLRKRKEKDE